MKSSAQIFLCYAKEDMPKVERLYHRLEDAGFKPWMDKVNLIGGEEWGVAIQKAIRGSDFFVACVSNHWHEDRQRFLRREIKTALDVLPDLKIGDIFVVPIRLEECDVPENLSLFQWIDYFHDDGWDRLVKSLHKAMDRLGLKKLVILRQEPRILTREDAFLELQEWNLYDQNLNPTSKGLEHQYEMLHEFVVYDKATRLMWQKGGSASPFSPEGVMQCITYMNQQKYGGYNDWRLPTLQEAMSLMERDEKNSGLRINPVFDKTQSYIWTSDLDDKSNHPWVVYFNLGYCYNYTLVGIMAFYVRAVRCDKTQFLNPEDEQILSVWDGIGNELLIHVKT